MLSDRDPRFLSHFWTEFEKLSGTEHLYSTAFHPQTGGQHERVNRILEEMLRAYVSPAMDDWDDHLAMAEFAINNAWQFSTKTTPFTIVYNRRLRTPLNTKVQESLVPAAQAFVGRWHENLQRAKRNLRDAQQRQKAYADQNRREVTFEVGDRVLLSTKNIKLKGPEDSQKLMPHILGRLPSRNGWAKWPIGWTYPRA